MLKRTIIFMFTAISFLNLINFPSIYAEDKPAVWLKVTAEGVPGVLLKIADQDPPKIAPV